jgi:hypothetical protein
VDFPNDITFDPTGRFYLACWPRSDRTRNIAGGAYTSDDGGLSWSPIFDTGMHVYSVAVDPVNPNNLYISTFDAALFFSSDLGSTWKLVPGYDFQWGVRPVPDPYNPGMVFLTTFGSSVWYGSVESTA